jgi:uncharacterized protein (DUF433 family)
MHRVPAGCSSGVAVDELLKRIVIDPKVMAGKPVIRGTRLTVEHLLKELANGRSPDELIDAHPRATADDIRAAYAYAAASLSKGCFRSIDDGKSKANPFASFAEWSDTADENAFCNL